MNNGFTFKTGAVLTVATMMLGSGLSRGAVAPPPPAAAPMALPAPAPAATPASGAKIQFDNTVYDFGKAQPTDTLKHEFVFTNIGTTTLEITSVRPGCGCTTAGEWTKTVEPGQTGTIPIQFIAANFSGSVAKGVTVTCNDPAQSNIYLQIKGTVFRPVEVNPRYAYFTVLEGTETNQTKIVRIVNHAEEDMEVSPPEWDNKGFNAELKTVRPGKEFEVHISLVPPIQSSGSLTPIKLKTTSKHLPEVNISAYAMVQSAVQIMPQHISLPFGPVGAGAQYSVMIRNNGAQPLALSEPSVNAEGVTATLRVIQPGRLFNVDLRFPGGFQIVPRQLVHLTVKSTSPSMPIIRVPITQVNSLIAMPQPRVLPPRHTTLVR